jgi:hypothetical protein
MAQLTVMFMGLYRYITLVIGVSSSIKITA